MEYEHIQWIVENHGEDLLLAVEREGIQIDPPDVLNLFINADPSQKKSAVDWMVKTYIAGGFLLEDLTGGLQSKVCETIGWFSQHRKKLEQRNLSSYGTLAEVYRAIQPFLTVQAEQKMELSGKALKRREKEEVFQESILLRREENLLLSVPLTKRAAQWWGKGTRWCTAATKSGDSVFEMNMFDHYNKTAPLVIIVFPKGLTGNSTKLSDDWEEEGGVRKFQIWVPEHAGIYQQIQFMDETDRAVSTEFVQENWSAFEPVIKWAFEKNVNAIKFFPQHAITKKMALKLLQGDRDFIKFIPESVIDQEIVDLLVSGEKHFLSGVPEKFLTSELCKRAFSACNTNIACIPYKFQTKEMCKEALSLYISSIQYLNPDQLDKKMIVKALDDYQKNRAAEKDILRISYDYSRYNNSKPLKIFYKNIPERLKTSDILDRLSVIDIAIMLDFESHQITREMAKRAIMNHSSSISKIPDHFWDDELISLLVDKSPSLIRLLNTQLLSKPIIVKSLNNPENEMLDFDWIPKNLIDKEIIEIVVNKSSFGAHALIASLPIELWDQETADIVLSAQPGLMQYVPKQFVSKDLEVKENINHIITGMGKGRVIDGLHMGRGSSIMNTINTIQSFGRVFRTQRELPELPVVLIDEIHGLFTGNSGAERKWDESSLNGLRIQEVDKDFKPK